MKKILLLLTGIVACLTLNGQARKPTIMVVPSEVWCREKGYMQKYETMLGTDEIPDWRAAVRSNREMINVITKIGSLMTDKGFNLVDLSFTISSSEQNQAMNRAMQSRSGAAIAESPVDIIMRQASADILLEIDWEVHSTGPRRTITYNLRGLDAYTRKLIASSQGTGQPSVTAEIHVLLEEAVVTRMESFTEQLQAHFDELFAIGREVTVDILVYENDNGIDLETEYEGRELTEIISDWMDMNTVNHQFNKSRASENFIYFDQVRIPILRPNGRPMDTESFVRELSNYLRAEPYKVPVRVQTRGLGKGVLIIGER